MQQHAGQFPQSPDQLATLPGIGRSTAAAIAAFSFGARAAILDGNVKRVLARWAAIEGYTGSKAIETQLWSLAESLLPNTENVAAYTQGLMDLGSLICTRSKPQCERCPLADDCQAHALGLQKTLPTPKPRKTIPERHVVLMIIENQGQILLERRPPSGIWGGLWSLPEASDTLSAAATCRDRYGLEVEFDAASEDFTHVFTHFRLVITPLRGYVQNQRPQVAEANHAWFTAQTAGDLGLPAPVRRLLET